MGPQDPKEVTGDTARDLSGMVGELAALKADVNHRLTGPEYATLRYRLEAAYAVVEAALEEARRVFCHAPLSAPTNILGIMQPHVATANPRRRHPARPYMPLLAVHRAHRDRSYPARRPAVLPLGCRSPSSRSRR